MPSIAAGRANGHHSTNERRGPRVLHDPPRADPLRGRSLPAIARSASSGASCSPSAGGRTARAPSHRAWASAAALPPVSGERSQQARSGLGLDCRARATGLDLGARAGRPRPAASPPPPTATRRTAQSPRSSPPRASRATTNRPWPAARPSGWRCRQPRLAGAARVPGRSRLAGGRSRRSRGGRQRRRRGADRRARGGDRGVGARRPAALRAPHGTLAGAQPRACGVRGQGPSRLRRRRRPRPRRMAGGPARGLGGGGRRWRASAARRCASPRRLRRGCAGRCSRALRPGLRARGGGPRSTMRTVYGCNAEPSTAAAPGRRRLRPGVRPPRRPGLLLRRGRAPRLPPRAGGSASKPPSNKSASTPALLSSTTAQASASSSLRLSAPDRCSRRPSEVFRGLAGHRSRPGFALDDRRFGSCCEPAMVASSHAILAPSKTKWLLADVPHEDDPLPLPHFLCRTLIPERIGPGRKDVLHVLKVCIRMRH